MFVTCVYPLMYENGCTFAMPFGRATRRRSRNHWLTFKGIAIVSCSTADEASTESAVAAAAARIDCLIGILG